MSRTILMQLFGTFVIALCLALFGAAMFTSLSHAETSTQGYAAPAGPHDHATPTKTPAMTPIPLTKATIARFEGVWAGEDNPSPFGPIPFAADFRWQEDGTLRSLSALSAATWVDLRFRPEGETWVLDEEAQLAGEFRQGYPLHPLRAANDTIYFAYLPDPHYLTCGLYAGEETLEMRVWVRGEDHVRFRLERLHGEEALAQRRDLEENRTRPGENDLVTLQGAGASSDPIEVANARAATKLQPREATVHMRFGNVLAGAMQEATQTQRIRYAGEMLAAFRTAVELDPDLVDAHYGLSQYYLNAPPIAGGSVEAARAEADELERLASPMAEVVRAQIEAKGGDRAAAAARLQALLESHPDLTQARRLYIQYADQSEVSQ